MAELSALSVGRNSYFMVSLGYLSLIVVLGNSSLDNRR